MLRRRPALLCFPALSAGVLGVVLLIAWLQPLRGIWERARLDQSPTTGQYIALLVVFFLVSCTSTYVNAALLHSVHALGQGPRPAVRASLRAALRRLPTLLAWCLLGSSLGMVLRVLESTAGVSWIFEPAGTSWSLRTFFVLPVIVVEGTGLFTGPRQSRAMGRAELGNRVAGGIRLALTTVLVVVVAIIALILAVESDKVTVMVATAGCVVALFLATGLLSATVSGIHRMTLHQRAVARRPA